jgi:hypothetical protein
VQIVKRKMDTPSKTDLLREFRYSWASQFPSSQLYPTLTPQPLPAGTRFRIKTQEWKRKMNKLKHSCWCLALRK